MSFLDTLIQIRWDLKRVDNQQVDIHLSLPLDQCLINPNNKLQLLRFQLKQNIKMTYLILFY